MDQPSALNAVGQPFYFDQMEHQGRVGGPLADFSENVLTGRRLDVDSRARGPRRTQMPLAMDVLGFDETAVCQS